MYEKRKTDWKEWLPILAAIAGIVAACIACIALLPAFGAWLFPKAPIPSPSPNISVPTRIPTQFFPPTEPPATAPPAPTSTREIPNPTPLPPRPILGRGDIIRGNGLSVQLVDYEFRPEEHPEPAAVYYTLAFINETNAPIEIVFTLADISAMDNIYNSYQDFLSVAKQWYDNTGYYGCIIVGVPEYPLDQQFSIPANSSENMDYYLNPVGTEGNCDNWGAAKGRVPFETEYIDLKFADLKYRTDRLHELSGLRWRLIR